jgi:hypothetical protein
VKRLAPVLLAAFLAAVSARAADDPPAYSIQGTATNAVTGELLRRATIHLQGVQSQTATADAGGRFSFTSLSSGTYVLSAEKQGFAPGVRQLVSIGPSRDDVKLELAPFGHIAGSVVDENGDPVLNATIQVFRSIVLNGRRQTVNVSGGLTNDRGEFRVSSLPPGRFFVGAIGQPEADGTAYPRVFYGGTDDITSAAPLELRPGADIKVSITLRPAPSYRVRGKVANLEPGQHPFVNLVRKGSPFAASEARNSQMNPATGEFEFGGVTPGTYVVTAGCFERGSQLSGTADVVVSDGDAEGVSMALAKTPELTGVVRGDPAGTDVRGVSISARPATDGSQASMGAQIKDDGTFALTLMQPGDYFLAVRVSEPRYVKSVLMGGHEIGASSFPVSQAGAQGSFEVVVGTGGGRLEGTVTDGNAPAGNVAVLLLGTGQEKLAQTDATGAFRFEALAPGEYTAYALTDLQDVEYMKPEVMGRYSGGHVSVTAGDSQRIELKLNRTVY